MANDNSAIHKQLRICSALSDNTKRLTCYDQMTQKVQSSIIIQEPIKTHIKKQIKAQPIKSAEQRTAKFGAQHLEKDVDEIEKIDLTIAKIEKSLRGLKIFHFTNGQVWKESSKKYFKVKKGDKVFIKKAVFGSFIIGTNKNNQITKVKRVK